VNVAAWGATQVVVEVLVLVLLDDVEVLVLVLLDDVEVLVLVLLDDVVGAVVVVVADVVVVAPTQEDARLKLEAKGQVELHAWPAGQQVSAVPLPQGVLPLGQPQKFWAWSAHGTPALQQDVPHGVVPAGQQQDVTGCEQVWPLAQQPLPQACAPAGQVTAVPRKGRSMVTPAAAAIVAATTLSAPRRDVGAAMARVRSSNRSLTGCLLLRQRRVPQSLGLGHFSSLGQWVLPAGA
jgi:hypothetical protein